MTRDQFMRHVRAKAPGRSQVSLDVMAAEMACEGKIGEQYVDVGIGLAAVADKAIALDRERQALVAEAIPDEDEPFPSAPMLTRDDLLEKLQPLLKAVRVNIFHHEQAPCSSKEAAADWIKGKASEPCYASDEDKARLYQLDRDLSELATEWRARTGLEWREGGLTRSLPYEDGEEGGVKVVCLEAPTPSEEHPCMPSPVLVELQRAVEGMAEVTGFYYRLITRTRNTGVER